MKNDDRSVRETRDIYPPEEAVGNPDGIVDLEFETCLTNPVTGSDVVEVDEGLTDRTGYREPSGESSWPSGVERPN